MLLGVARQLEGGKTSLVFFLFFWHLSQREVVEVAPSSEAGHRCSSGRDFHGRLVTVVFVNKMRYAKARVPVYQLMQNL